MMAMSACSRRIPRAEGVPGKAGLKAGHYTGELSRWLPFEEIHFVGQDGLAIAEKGDDDPKPYGRFGSRVGDDEQSEDLAGDIAKNSREENEIDVNGVEDQLDGH
jgi:hypothetical protein